MFKSKKRDYQYAVLGLGRWGITLARELYETGCEVLAADNDEERIRLLGEDCTHSVVADLADEAVLKSLGIDAFDTVIVAIGDNMQASIICALTCKELGAKHIIAKAINEKHAKILNKIGIDQVIIPEDDSAMKTVRKLLHPNVAELLESEEGYSVAEIVAPDDWVNKSLIELQLRKLYHLNVLMIVGNTGTVIPDGTERFSAGDRITLGGIAKDMKVFLSKLN